LTQHERKAQKLPGVSLEPDFESFFYFSFLPIPSPPLSGITRKKQFLIDNTFLLRLATANRIQGKFRHDGCVSVMRPDLILSLL
jgi:hypothetical protein